MAILTRSSYLDTDTAPSAWMNTASNSLAAAATPAAIAALETAAGDPANGIVARVIHISGNYVKIKWYKDGKPFGIYKARGHTLAKATEALEFYKNNTLGISATVSLAITGTASGIATSTSQLTATLTRADTTTSNVTAQAAWSTSDATKATVSAGGLVTRVATGTAIITANYAGRSNTFTITIT